MSQHYYYRHARDLKGHCIEFKYYADGIHTGLTPPGLTIDDFKGALYSIWCGVNRLGDSGVKVV